MFCPFYTMADASVGKIWEAGNDLHDWPEFICMFLYSHVKCLWLCWASRCGVSRPLHVITAHGFSNMAALGWLDILHVAQGHVGNAKACDLLSLSFGIMCHFCSSWMVEVVRILSRFKRRGCRGYLSMEECQQICGHVWQPPQWTDCNSFTHTTSTC